MGQNKHSRLAYPLGTQEVLDVNTDFEGSERGPDINFGTLEGPRVPQSRVLGQWDPSADGATKGTAWVFIVVSGFKKHQGEAMLAWCSVLCPTAGCCQQ